MRAVPRHKNDTHVLTQPHLPCGSQTFSTDNLLIIKDIDSSLSWHRFCLPGVLAYAGGILHKMMSHSQHTIRSSIKFSGIGLHSGQKIHVTIKPAPIDTGIEFKIIRDGRCDITIPALSKHTGALVYNTSLQMNGVQIQTVEHLLSALAGYGVDNASIVLDNTEIPILDGSASAFVFLLSECGLQEQSAVRSRHRLVRDIRIGDSSAWITATPTSSNALSIDYSIDFAHPCIGEMRMMYQHDPSNYVHSIAPARTFGFLREVEFLQRQGLIRGASLENAIVLDDTHVLTGDLRFPDEFVRHKILDFFGDISLLGTGLIAHIRAHKAGHKLHAQLVHQLLTNPGFLEPVYADETSDELVYIPARQEALVC